MKEVHFVENTWTSLPVYTVEFLQDTVKPTGEIYIPKPIWKKPAGQAVHGVDALKLTCQVNSLKESPSIVIGDTGAAPTLISESFLNSLRATKPKRRKGRDLELNQLTGVADTSDYVKIDLYFASQLGTVRLQGVEAYIVKDMKANLLIGEDTQTAWQIHTIRARESKYWKIGDSPHLIPGLPSPIPVESFTAQWSTTHKADKKGVKKPLENNASRRTLQKALAQSNLTIKPESIATITGISKGGPYNDAMYFEACPLARGKDSFICAASGIVNVSKDGTFLVKIANTSQRNIRVRSGELLGTIRKAKDTLRPKSELSDSELNELATKTTMIATLIDGLDEVKTRATPEPSKEDPESNWGPKTTDPGPEQIYPSEMLREFIDVDPSLRPDQRDALYKVVEQNVSAFGFDGRLGHLDAKVHIELLPGTKPLSQPPYGASPAKRELISDQVDAWLAQDVIEESKSPWGAPVLIVFRDDKKPRVCIDYRRLNKVTVADQHPIPKQTDILQALSGAQYLSVFDALSGFTQLEFDKESRPLTAFRTHKGLHQFKRMPFGWRNGPAEFQRAMQEILSPFLWLFTLVYIDDIIVYSKTFEEHLHHVDVVLKAIANSGLTLSPPKCHLGYQSIIVLGNKVSRLGLSTHHEKLRAIWELKAPHDRKSLMTFLGTAVYFAAYIPYFSWMATPLFKLLRGQHEERNGPIEWLELHQKCFDTIKAALVSAPVRGHPEAGHAYRLYTDASDFAIAGTLQQVQYIAVKDLLYTRAYKRLQDAYNKGLPPPDMVLRLSKDFDDKRPVLTWSKNWEDTEVPVERVIAYWSRVLHSAETRYSATEREALAAKESLVRFQPFIEGERILLVTDHAALTWAKTYENANKRLAAWGLVFAAFPEMVIVHRPGRVHSNVDPLSRLPRIPEFVSPSRQDLPTSDASTEYEEMQRIWTAFVKERTLALDVNAITTRSRNKKNLAKPSATTDEEASEQPSLLNDSSIEKVVKESSKGKTEDVIDLSGGNQLHLYANEEVILRFKSGYKADRSFSPILARSKKEKDIDGKFRAYRLSDNGLLYFLDSDHKIRLCVPKSEIKTILQEIHDGAHESAHAGRERTLSAVREKFYWPSLRKDVSDYVKSCDVCQKVKHDRSGKTGYLKPLEIPAQPFDTISLDFISGLPMSNGKNAILVVVDKLTKYAHFIPTTTEINASETAQLLFDEIIKTYGLPRVIVGDRDPRWTSSLWQELAQLMNTRLALSTSKHPQTDGQTEAMNQQLETMLRAYVQHDKKSWSQWLNILHLAYNNSRHSSHQQTPAYLLFGYHPRTPTNVLREQGLKLESYSTPVQLRVQDIRDHRDAARDAITKSADKQAYQYDKRRNMPRFKVGDEVLINPHSLELLESKGEAKKLVQRYIGPFEVTEIISPTSYRLRLPDTYPMHNVVNLEHLTKYTRSPDTDRTLLPNPRDFIQASEEYEIERIVQERTRKGKTSYLVRWIGYGAEHDLWLSRYELRNAPEILANWKLSQ